MKRKKFFLDPKIVLKKKDLMMEKQVNEFSNVFGEFHRCREYYCAELGDNERVKLGLEEDGKFAAKFFSTYIVLEMEDVYMRESWEARLEFRGSVRISDLVWKPVKKEHRKMVEKLNRCAEFNSKLLDISRNFDLVTIELKYLQDSRTFIVKIFPYAGSYVWVKLPPAHYEIPLSKDEVKCIYKITELFAEEFEDCMEG